MKRYAMLALGLTLAACATEPIDNDNPPGYPPWFPEALSEPCQECLARIGCGAQLDACQQDESCARFLYGLRQCNIHDNPYGWTPEEVETCHFGVCYGTSADGEQLAENLRACRHTADMTEDDWVACFGGQTGCAAGEGTSVLDTLEAGACTGY